MFYNIWDKVFKNGLSKICRRLLLKNLNRYGLLPVIRLNTDIYSPYSIRIQEADHILSDFLKTVFHKFYLVHSWILYSIYSAKMKIVVIEHLIDKFTNTSCGVLCKRRAMFKEDMKVFVIWNSMILWPWNIHHFIILKPRLNCFSFHFEMPQKIKVIWELLSELF